MNRITSSMLSAALLALLIAAPVGAAGGRPTTVCSKGAVESAAKATIAVDRRHLGGTDPDSLDSADSQCDFRLYDNNDDPDDPFGGPLVDNPEVPHVFADDDWFIGGIFYFLTKEEMATLGWTRKQAGEYLDSIEDHLFWRKQGDASWTELPLSQTTHRSGMTPPFGFPVLDHRYHVFAPGSLAPDTYEWHWEVAYDALFGPFEAHGEVLIVDN